GLGALQVVEHHQQLTGQRGLRREHHRLAVAFHPLAVVGVLGGDPLEVLGQLVDPLLQLRLGFRARGGLLGRCFRTGFRRRLALLRLGLRLLLVGHRIISIHRVPELSGDRVDAPPVPDNHRFLLVVVLGHVGVVRRHFFFSSSSSTISASTTSSLFAELEELPADPLSAPAPAPAAFAPASAYSACPKACDSVASFSTADLIAETSSPLRASLTSLMAALTLSLTSDGNFSSLSLRTFSVW